MTHGFTLVSLSTELMETYKVESGCEGYEKKDKDRIHTSGAYKAYKPKCYNDETGRKSFLMSKQLDKDKNPWDMCIRVSTGPWCTGPTIGLQVQTLGTHVPLASA